MSEIPNIRPEKRRLNHQRWSEQLWREQNGYSNKGYVGGENLLPNSYYWNEQKGKGWIGCSWRHHNNQCSAYEWMNTPFLDQAESSYPASSSLASLANMCADIGVAENMHSSLQNGSFNTFQLNQTLSTSTKSAASELGLFRDPHKKVDWDGLVDDIFTDEIAKLADRLQSNIVQ